RDHGLVAEHAGDLAEPVRERGSDGLAQPGMARAAAHGERQVSRDGVGVRDAELVVDGRGAALGFEHTGDTREPEAALAAAQRRPHAVADEDDGSGGDLGHDRYLIPTREPRNGPGFRWEPEAASRGGVTSRVVPGGCIDLVQGDITHQATDAIVNAANTTLLGGGGGERATPRAGGAPPP